MMSLQQYPPTATDIASAFDAVSAVFVSDKVSIPMGTPGAYFVNVAKEIPAIPATTP
jgi:hypothetical protein